MRIIAFVLPDGPVANCRINIGPNAWVGGPAVPVDGVAYVALSVDDGLADTQVEVTRQGFHDYSTHVRLTPNMDQQIRIGVAADPARPQDIILPAMTAEFTTLPRVTTSGLGFVANGQPWRMAFVTSFRLYERYLNGQDITPVLQETRDVGANGVRIFGSFDFGSPDQQRLYPREHGDYFDALAPFFSLLASYGLYAEFVAFADTARSVGSSGEQQNHWAFLRNALGGITNVLLERVNEQDAHENAVTADLPAPAGITCSFGSNGAGSNPPLGPWGDYAALHSERPSDLPKLEQSTTTLTFAINGYPGWVGTHRTTVCNEPIGFADTDQPGRRVASPAVAYLLGLGCQWGAGGTAHSDNGVQSILLSPVQRACVEQFIRGVQA